MASLAPHRVRCRGDRAPSRPNQRPKDYEGSACLSEDVWLCLPSTLTWGNALPPLTPPRVVSGPGADDLRTAGRLDRSRARAGEAGALTQCRDFSPNRILATNRCHLSYIASGTTVLRHLIWLFGAFTIGGS